MASGNNRLVLLVHGWSVHNTNTYGKLADRLEAEARRDANLSLDIKQIWLSQYVSFRDEVRLEDVSRAFDAAVRREVGPFLDQGRRFVCITHSTGGPVVRDWWDRYYVQRPRSGTCPMSHLIMLAPANFGSALAQLGKSRIGRLKSWFEGVEPGVRILDWLELGSPESWELNQRWFDYPATPSGRKSVFPFVLTGQSIDRSLYDNLNSYTGEMGSDGVVRVAAANLNATHVVLEQEQPTLLKDGSRPTYEAKGLKIKAVRQAPRTAFALIKGKSHSGKKMGIMRSITSDRKANPTVDAILACLRVETPRDYQRLCADFEALTADVQRSELLEKDGRLLLPDRYFIHDPHSMVIFRVRDDFGYLVADFDLVLTAGPQNDPNHLPKGFFGDRQKNKRDPGALTYFFNHAIMVGAEAVVDEHGETRREATKGARSLGFRMVPYLNEDLVHYLSAELRATPKQLGQFLKPHQTTMVDITLRRIVRERVFRLTTDRLPQDFSRGPAGPLVP